MIASLILALAAGGPGAAASADPPIHSVITNPSWDRRPEPEMPPVAMMLGLSGRVALRCQVTPQGRIEACETSADPEGVGFAEAALRATTDARLNPRTVDGEPTFASITFNVSFAPGDTLDLPSYTGPEPTAEAIEFYRQPLIFGATYDMLACIDLDQLTDEERTQVAPHLRDAFDDYRSEWIDAFALALARVTPPEAFNAWRAGDRAAPPTQRPDDSALDQVRTVETRIFARARERYCAMHDCPWA